MKNRIVGMIMIGVALLMGFIIFSFNRALESIISTACSHGTSCPMWGTINFQTNISVGIMSFVILVGVYLIFFGKEKEVVTKVKTIKSQVKPKKITKEHYRTVMSKLDADEKLVFEKIIESEGTIFQSDLIDKTDFSKVKITRVLDKLEGKRLVERRRRGMTNVVILKG